MDIAFHKAQLKVYTGRHRIQTLMAGRRFGKTKLTVWRPILDALQFPGTIDPVSPETILITEPTLVMAKQLIWYPLVSILEDTDLSRYVKKINKTEHRIEFHGGKPPIVVAGANDNNGDGLRGKRLYRFYGDEVQDLKPGVFDTVIIPAMADTKGSRAQLTFTPKGTLNWTYELSKRGHKDPTYKHYHFTTLDNPFVPRKEVRSAELTLPPRLYRQEFLASFENFEGQIYSELSEDRNKCDRLPESFDLVVLGVDWGDTFPAVVALGMKAGTWFFLEGWQGRGHVVAEPIFQGHIIRLAAKWGAVGTYCDPSRPSSILTLRALGDQYRLQGLQEAIAGFNRIEDGISQIHTLIYQGRLRFAREVDYPPSDPGTVTPDHAYKLFEAYHRETNKAGLVTEKVAGGQDDHTCDALRYALAIPDGLPQDILDDQ